MSRGGSLTELLDFALEWELALVTELDNLSLQKRGRESGCSKHGLLSDDYPRLFVSISTPQWFHWKCEGKACTITVLTKL